MSEIEQTKFCKYCGNRVHVDAVMCPHCGRQIEEFKTSSNSSNPQIVINNVNSNSNNVGDGGYYGKRCDKLVALLLCVFLGMLGAHKFYEGKIGQGILYLFTGGLLGIGWLIDIVAILFKPNPYYV